MKIHWTRSLALKAVKQFGLSFEGSVLYYHWPPGVRPGRRLVSTVYVITITSTGTFDLPLDSLKGTYA
jgi:hypothetical protein